MNVGEAEQDAQNNEEQDRAIGSEASLNLDHDQKKQDKDQMEQIKENEKGEDSKEDELKDEDADYQALRGQL